MNVKRVTIILSIICLSVSALRAQEKVEFEGQVSTIFSFSPDNDLNAFSGGRYIPKLSYKIPVDSTHFIDFEAAANISGSLLFHPFDSINTDGTIAPYRLWARYAGSQYEIRVGLQKIDFGSATLLRPLQWFNQIDPRDPLQLTNGVYGLLGRYYFLNNANIWIWGLIGNEKTRGFDIIETNNKIPEVGARVQLPIPKGEIALSYHFRTANSIHQPFVTQHEEIPEHKIGIDGKWDLTVGLWLEAVYSHKTKEIGQFTNQTLINIGTDYTFGVGNGLNVVAEHLLTSFDETAFDFGNTRNITALTAAYPITFLDNISTVLYYDWAGKDFSFFLNYQHQFQHVIGYLITYYNPSSQQGIQQNDLVNNFSGPGIRLMFVYNH